jgi:hypothetical protein
MVWMSPRGVIAAATASLFTIILKEQGYPQAEALETIVFVVINIVCYCWDLPLITISNQTEVLFPSCSPVLILLLWLVLNLKKLYFEKI